MSTVSAVVVSQDRLSRQALDRLLRSSDVDVLAAFDNAAEAAESLANGEDPEVFLLDFSMEPPSIVDELALLRRRFPPSQIVVLTGSPSDRTMTACLATGVAAYLTKDITAEALTQCIRLVMLGIAVWPTNLAAMLAARGASISRLSKREVEVLQCLVQGDTNKEIARRLDIAEETVKCHIRALTRRLNARNRVQLAIWARANGLQGAQAPTMTGFATQHSGYF